MIVWGGISERGFANSGGRYIPMANTWMPTATIDAPAFSSGHTAVWTGSEMIVWGGISEGGYANSEHRYNPAANSWAAMSTTGAPDGRSDHTAVWTGSEMIVWGGYPYWISAVLNDTWSYTPGRTLYLYLKP